MAKLTFKTDACKGCGLCVDACPKKLLQLSPDKLNEKGYHPVMITDEEACVACGSCFRTCPDTVITIVKE